MFNLPVFVPGGIACEGQSSLRHAAGLTLNKQNSNGQPDPRPPPQLPGTQGHAARAFSAGAPPAPFILQLLQWWVPISFPRSWVGAGFWEKMAVTQEG